MRCKKHKNQSPTSNAVRKCNDCQRERLMVILLRRKTPCVTCGKPGKMFEKGKWVCGKMDHKIDGFQLAKFKAFKREARRKGVAPTQKPVEVSA